MKRFLLAAAIAAYGLSASAQTATQAKPKNLIGDAIESVTQGYIKTHLDYSNVMFDRQEYVTNKPLQQLLFRADGRLENQSLYLGGRFIGSAMHERTNANGKFPILSRIPDQHTSGETGNEYVINDASLNITVTPTSWLTGFIQGEYTEVEYPGQNEKQIRKYSVTVGDLSRFPVYATFGRNTVSFGNYTSYAPFTHNHSSHYFWAQSDDPHLEVGYYKDGLQVAGSLIQSNRGRRVLNTPDSEGWGNFAVSARKAFEAGKGVRAEIGAGYLHSTIYDSTLAHHPPIWNGGDNDENGLLNIHGTLTVDMVDVNMEYTQTLDDWPATNHPVSAFTAQGRIRHDLFEHPAIASLMYSKGTQGEDGTNWERMEQIVTGYEVQLHDNVKIGAEYLYNTGFVPLILPTITGDRDVISHTFLVGVEATF